MAGLLYREDMDDVRQRLTTWWEGGDIGRPAMVLVAPRPEPVEDIPATPKPQGWVTDYSTSDYAYRVQLGLQTCNNSLFLGEAVPAVSPDLAPNCLALFLGCRGVEHPGTVWCEPFIEDPESARFPYDPDNFYWDFSWRLAQEQQRMNEGRYLLEFPDIIEGLDTLAAMRGTQELLIDLVCRPEWVHDCMRKITDLYFRYYDMYYDLMRDEVGGSIYWVWAPGRCVKIQCDFSAMISPEMYEDFMLPVVEEMCQRISYCLYHWDGPGALPHHDLLLSVPNLRVIQWTPGDGHERPGHKRWWPMYHKTIDAGRRLFISIDSVDELLAMKREFGPKLNSFLFRMWVPSEDMAKRYLAAAEA